MIPNVDKNIDLGPSVDQTMMQIVLVVLFITILKQPDSTVKLGLMNRVNFAEFSDSLRIQSSTLVLDNWQIYSVHKIRTPWMQRYKQWQATMTNSYRSKRQVTPYSLALFKLATQFQ